MARIGTQEIDALSWQASLGFCFVILLVIYINPFRARAKGRVLRIIDFIMKACLTLCILALMGETPTEQRTIHAGADAAQVTENYANALADVNAYAMEIYKVCEQLKGKTMSAADEEVYDQVCSSYMGALVVSNAQILRRLPALTSYSSTIFKSITADRTIVQKFPVLQGLPRQRQRRSKQAQQSSGQLTVRVPIEQTLFSKRRASSSGPLAAVSNTFVVPAAMSMQSKHALSAKATALSTALRTNPNADVVMIYENQDARALVVQAQTVETIVTVLLRDLQTNLTRLASVSYYEPTPAPRIHAIPDSPAYLDGAIKYVYDIGIHGIDVLGFKGTAATLKDARRRIDETQQFYQSLKNGSLFQQVAEMMSVGGSHAILEKADVLRKTIANVSAEALNVGKIITRRAMLEVTITRLIASTGTAVIGWDLVAYFFLSLHALVTTPSRRRKRLKQINTRIPELQRQRQQLQR